MEEAIAKLMHANRLPSIMVLDKATNKENYDTTMISMSQFDYIN